MYARALLWRKLVESSSARRASVSASIYRICHSSGVNFVTCVTGGA